MISAEEFGMWKQHEITKKLFDALENYKKDAEEAMTNPSLIMSDRCQRELARLVGLIEGINLVLNVNVESVEDDEDEKS